MLSLEKTDKVREEVKAAAFSHIASLSFCCLKAFPAQLLANESLLALRRLDLSHNHIAQIPDSISTLTNLKELWLQHNPLVEFPAGIPLMTKLEVIDISSTLIETIPAEMANLTKLYEVDWRSTPLAKTLLKFGIEVNDILKLRKHLLSLDTRKQLETQLFEYLEGEHYIQDADKKGIKTLILALVQVKGMLNCARSVTLLCQFFMYAFYRISPRSSTTSKSCDSTCAELGNSCRKRSSKCSTREEQPANRKFCSTTFDATRIGPGLLQTWKSK
jgi:hypothetical protein